MTTEERFWSKVNKDGPNGCWLWTAGMSKRGYGRLTIGRSGVDRHIEYAHRFAWKLTNGPIPDSMCLCHVCDTPLCVNPAHLFVGTQADNMRDMDRKGRRGSAGALGTGNHQAKFTEDEVRQIRVLLTSGTPQRQIASKFGVHQTSISRIATRSGWRHLN